MTEEIEERSYKETEKMAIHGPRKENSEWNPPCPHLDTELQNIEKMKTYCSCPLLPWYLLC